MANETFNANWDNNDAQFTFNPTDLEQMEFDEILAGVLDLVTNVFTDELSVSGAGRRLVLRVSDSVGQAAGAPIDITVEWTDFGVGSQLDIVPLNNNTPQDTQFVISAPGAAGPTDVFNMSAAAVFDEGEVQTFISRSTAETFENDWPAPTPGLE
jgi:hypothetical protein